MKPYTTTTTTPTAGVKKGGRLNIGHQTPSGAMDPILTADLGRLTILGLCGEYLAFSDQNLALRPVIATSWTPNADGSVWTFKIRQGVKFSDGTAMTVDDRPSRATPPCRTLRGCFQKATSARSTARP